MMLQSTDFTSHQEKNIQPNKKEFISIQSTKYGQNVESKMDAMNIASSEGRRLPNTGARSPSPSRSPTPKQHSNILPYQHLRSRSYGQSPLPSKSYKHQQQTYFPHYHNKAKPTHTPQQKPPQSPNPNWTALIPPMPAFPSPSYQRDSSKLSSSKNPPNSTNHVSKNTGSNLYNPKPSQRHSIAYSPSGSMTDIDIRNFQSSGSIPISNSPSRQAPPNPPPMAPTSERPPNTDVVPRGNTKRKKICKKCGLEITGQFVRALHNAFHVDCFCCQKCGKQCSAKFFPYEVTDSLNGSKSIVALCEYDYFKELDLICFSCNSALRGPYITALGNKYHLEHFKCAVCQKVFESDESYYEHDDEIYCHYHYSKLYATHCEGCHSSIVKQFVELFRGGRNQQWHPECYMVHKFWNVCITVDSVGLQQLFGISMSTMSLRNLKESNIDGKLLLAVEQQIENVVMSCWLTLSGYEEVTASGISDMLLNACIGNQKSGLMATGKLILHIEVLFRAIDYVQDACQQSIGLVQQPDDLTSSLDHDFFQPLRKEPRNISGKVMSYLAILRKSNQLATSGSLSAELLSVITGCAHYLKLLIRIGLNNALKINKLKGSTVASEKFLDLVKRYEVINHAKSAIDVEETNSKDGRKSSKSSDSKAIGNIIGNVSESPNYLDYQGLSIPPNSTDACYACAKSIEKSCLNFGNMRWHLKCFKCSKCNKEIPVNEASNASFSLTDMTIICENCFDNDSNAQKGFELVSNLSQLIYLLKIAFSRSKSVMNIPSTLPSKIEANDEKGMTPINEDERDSTMIEDDYSKTLRDVTRLRTRRQSQKLSSSIKQNARKSVILEAPEADKAKEDVTIDKDLSDNNLEESQNRKASVSSKMSYSAEGENDQFRVKNSLKIRDEPIKQLTNSHLDRTSDLLQNEKSLTLDDIPRIVAAEQAREQRPNAFKHHNSLYQKQKPMQPVKAASVSAGGIPDYIQITSESQDPTTSSGTAVTAQKSKYYSELTKSEHFILRHIAIEAIIETRDKNLTTDELLPLIQTRKLPNFWDKFKFGGNDPKRYKSSPVFGIDIQDLTSRYGVDSDLGVGPSKLRIPIVVDDIINALRQKDMSVEGIFRLNGNIKKLREMTDQINKSPLKSPDFSNQSAVQLAALMKKWLRELPTPLLTYSLHELWISSQREKDTSKCKRILQLTYCMLPRSHRNLVEVLLYFFSWVASFAEIDDETGSKMDIHNLATVISPNILYSKQSSANDQVPQSGETYFLAIEVVNQLIELHEELSIVPPDLLEFFEKCGFQNMKTDNISTKEIMNIIDKTLKKYPNFFQNQTRAKIGSENHFNQHVRSNTVERGHSKVFNESHGESWVA
ncbi:uncharacterized protein PRCAT00004183001 [Priceomyces carsonii]|uniref:uncharacterized protein n=1 Tax=Priceomyces carsonii TaxID=28549 RepID=UPI002ED874F6|nr:unnamed protein product [Priceomyces carsonii]